MSILVTGATGYVGAYVAAELLQKHQDPLVLLVRAQSEAEAMSRLWHALQLHLSLEHFREFLASRVRVVLGDVTLPRLGQGEANYRTLVSQLHGIIHCAAALTRKSERTCYNVNLRGALTVIQLARAIDADHGLNRFTHVSTEAVAGHRQDEHVLEDAAIDWQREDYDPYARTKKLAEHLVRELVPAGKFVIVRPAIILGDSRHAETTQFDMLRAFVALAALPALPFSPDARLDIVPGDFIAESIVGLHQKPGLRYDTYHLSAGSDAERFQAIADAVAHARGKRGPVFVPWTRKPFELLVNLLAHPQGGELRRGAMLLKVFMPYLFWNTVFDNQRIVEELGQRPKAFSSYCYPLLQFAQQHHFRYPYRAWPAGAPAQGS